MKGQDFDKIFETANKTTFGVKDGELYMKPFTGWAEVTGANSRGVVTGAGRSRRSWYTTGEEIEIAKDYLRR